MIVITGVSALRSTWWRITSPSRETLGAGGADVVGVELVEHRRPHEPRDDAHQAPAEHERRQHQLAQALPRQARSRRRAASRSCRSRSIWSEADRHEPAGDPDRGTIRAGRRARTARSGPSQNTGNDEPTRPTSRAMWSTDLVLVAGRRDAERDAADAADEQRPKASSAVAGSRSHRSDVTDCLVRNDVPRSPVNRLLHVRDVLLDDAAVEPPPLLGRGDDGLVVHVAARRRSTPAGRPGSSATTMNAIVTMPSNSSGVIASRRRT